MSRCVPFPPPGYLKNGAGGEKLLKQLELRREKALSKRKRKERGRKKERKKHRDNEDEVDRQQSCDDGGKDKDDKSTNCQGEMDNHIGRKHKNPELANITLTKELQGPIIPASDCSHKCELPRKFVEEKSSTSPSQVMLTSNPHRVNSECDKDLGGCLMGKSEFDPNVNPETPISTSSESSMLEIESEYRNLIVNWAPPPLQLRMVQTDFEDEEWLSKKNPSTSTKRTQTKQVSSDIDTYQARDESEDSFIVKLATNVRPSIEDCKDRHHHHNSQQAATLENLRRLHSSSLLDILHRVPGECMSLSLPCFCMGT